MKTEETFFYKYAKKMQEQTKEAWSHARMNVPEGLETWSGLSYQGEDDNPLSMDIYRSVRDPADSRLLPVIIMIHGGGLFMGDPGMEAGVCTLFAQKGFLVFSLSYRLLTEADACGEMADICEGFRHVARLLPEYGGDRNRVFVAGESAGAYLAVYSVALHRSKKLWDKVGCRLSNLTIRKMACFSGMFYTKKKDVIGLLYPKQIYGKRQSDKEFMEMMDPEHPEIINNLPPVLLVSSEADYLKKYTLDYEKALRDAGKDCQLLFYADNKELDHAFPSLKPWLKESREVIDRITDYFLE